jgi:hypothetical protein
LPFHSVSSAYLPPPRGTLIGMFNVWVWSLDLVDCYGISVSQMTSDMFHLP